jgi:hypothetical protein
LIVTIELFYSVLGLSADGKVWELPIVEIFGILISSFAKKCLISNRKVQSGGPSYAGWIVAFD